jgi:hypothetical protein
MAVGARTFVVRILADSKEAIAGLKKVGSEANKIGADMDKGIGSVLKGLMPSFKTLAIAGTAAFGALSAFTYKSVQAAIDAQAEQNRLRQILLNTVGATDAQIESLNKQAKALQDVGVVSAGTTSVVQAQLATFDLSVATIERLTPAILDYVTAEKGATASSEDFKAMTNGLAQALQGNFGSLTRTGFVLDETTKKTIASGTETERAAALVDVLNSTYEGFNATLRDTTEGRLQVLRNGFQDVQEEIGKALLPVLDRLLDYFNNKIMPVILNEVIPGFQMFIEKLGSDGLGVAITYGIAAMGRLGIATINALEAASFAALSFVRDLASVGEKIGMIGTLIGALSGGLLAPLSAGVGIGLGELETEIDKRLENIGSDFDNWRERITAAELEIGNLSKSQRVLSAESGRYTKIAESMGLEVARFDKKSNSASDTTKKLSGSVKDGKDALTKYTDAMKAANRAQDAYDKSTKSLNKSQESLTEANANLADAQRKFNQAVAGYGADSQQAKDAQRALDQAQRGVERAGYRVEESVFAIADAERELAEVRAKPGVSAQDVREAEIRLAEAKLSAADATDSQFEATQTLTQAQAILNEVVNGAIKGSETYERLAKDVAEAERRKADAFDAVTEAIKRQEEALAALQEAIKKTQGFGGRPGFASTVPNPIGGLVGGIGDSSTRFTAGSFAEAHNAAFPGTVNVTVNAGIGTSGVQVGQEINDYLTQYNRLNGGSFDRYGNIGIG